MNTRHSGFRLALCLGAAWGSASATSTAIHDVDMEGILRAVAMVTKGAVTQVSEPTPKCGLNAEAGCTAATYVGIAYDENIHSLTVLKVDGKWIIGKQQQVALDQAACLRNYHRQVALETEQGIVVDRKERQAALHRCYPERVPIAAFTAAPARSP
jgi:hypothetical protein